MPSVVATLQALVVELRATIVDLRAANVRLEERVRDLETRVGQHSGNSSRPPSSDLPGTPKRPPSRPSGRGRGGQPGHVAHQRAMAPPERVDVVTDHWPLHCQACEACLTVLPQTPGAPDFVAHQVTELPVIHPRITEYRLHRLACPSCGTRTRAALPAGVPTGSFGPRVQATVAMLGGRFRLSRRETSGVMGQVFGVPISIGSVDALCQATGEALAPVTAALVATLPSAPLLHADETRWPHDGHNWWLWMVRSAQATVFVLSPSRGGRVIRELIGADYHGVVTSDRYAGYNWLDPAFRQLCWAHLARNFEGLVTRGGDGTHIGVWARSLICSLFADRSAFVEDRTSLRTYQLRTRQMQSGFGDLLTQGTLSADLRVRRMCAGIDSLWPALWTYLDVPGVEPTNNVAERAIRPAVLWRKGSFGTQSGSGARFASAMLTVAATCRMHGLDLFAYLAGVCTASMAGHAVPQLLPASA